MNLRGAWTSTLVETKSTLNNKGVGGDMKWVAVEEVLSAISKSGEEKDS